MCAQRRLRSDCVLSESSHGTQWAAKDPERLQAESEDSDQPAWIRVFTGRKCSRVGNIVPRLIFYFWIKHHIHTAPKFKKRNVHCRYLTLVLLNELRCRDPLLIFSKLDYLIRIFTVFKGWVYPESAGQRLIKGGWVMMLHNWYSTWHEENSLRHMRATRV